MSYKDDSIILDLSKARSKGNSNRYYCSYCNTHLTALTREDMIGAYFCTKDNIIYWPNQQPVKKSNRFETPGPDTDKHGNVVGDKTIPITTVDDPNKGMSSTSYSSQKLPPAYEALKRAGFKWISYEER
jgi:hypothetical protein